jgi:hypothetical protein
MKSKKKLIPKVTCLNELYNLAAKDDKYRQLLLISASNLGGPSSTPDIAYQTLIDNATAGDGCSEEGVIDEVNFCRDLVK